MRAVSFKLFDEILFDEILFDEILFELTTNFLIILSFLSSIKSLIKSK